MDSFTRSEVGRSDKFFGAASFLPLDVPLMMRILSQKSEFRLPKSERAKYQIRKNSNPRSIQKGVKDGFLMLGFAQPFDNFFHIVLMGALPVDSLAIRAPVKVLLLIKNKVRDFSLGFLPWDAIEESIT